MPVELERRSHGDRSVTATPWNRCQQCEPASSDERNGARGGTARAEGRGALIVDPEVFDGDELVAADAGDADADVLELRREKGGAVTLGAHPSRVRAARIGCAVRPPVDVLGEVPEVAGERRDLEQGREVLMMERARGTELCAPTLWPCS